MKRTAKYVLIAILTLTFALFLAACGGGSTVTITASANNAAYGTVTGGGSVDKGASVTLTATANGGYSFVNWTESGTEVSKNTTYTFTADKNRTLTANFEADTSEPELKDASTYLSGARVLTSLSNVKDENNADKAFNEAIDRQLSALTDDLIYRLTTVYGVGGYNSNGTTNGYNIQDNVADYNYNDNKALINHHSVIVKPVSISDDLPVYNLSSNWFDITNTNDFAYSLTDGIWNTSSLLHSKIRLQLAISGGSTWSSNKFNTTNVENDAWSFSINYSSQTIKGYSEEFKAQYFDTIKLGIANMLASGSATTYNDIATAIENIDHIGILDGEKALIKSYILNNVIGTENVTRDNGRKPALNDISQAGAFTNDDQHYYKAYELLVGAMVDTAVANTFDGTSQTLYPVVSRINVQNKTLSELNAFAEYKSIVLKTNANTPVSAIQLKVSSLYNNSAKLTIKFNVYNGSATPAYSGVITPSGASGNQISLTTTETAYLFDLKAVMQSISTIGAFSGDTAQLVGNNLYTSNHNLAFNTSAGYGSIVSYSNGNNYIELEFSVDTDGEQFKVQIGGIYNKPLAA